MLDGDSVDKARRRQSYMGQVEHSLAAAPHAFQQGCGLRPQNPVCLVHGEAIVAGWYRRVRGKDALVANSVEVTSGNFTGEVAA